MNYQNIIQGRFIARPNRFIAIVEINGENAVCHVKNTGRCKELLIPNAKVWLEKSQNPNRKTEYDLICVEKGNKIINMDSQAPNKIAEEWLPKSGIFSPEAVFQREVKNKDSRFDLLAIDHGKKTWIEVKGVTLEEGGIARFPDAPTERGVKHVKHLTKIAKSGENSMILFVIQMKGIHHLEPNVLTHPAFGDALRIAAENRVKILAVDCLVSPESIIADQMIPVII
ncbi:MAG: DNA/RNA nuclease SfsA [Clostridia bacterium]|nr:DNA/RNA nuclease SfsA [Clostridia bacterium]